MDMTRTIHDITGLYWVLTHDGHWGKFWFTAQVEDLRFRTCYEFGDNILNLNVEVGQEQIQLGIETVSTPKPEHYETLWRLVMDCLYV